MEAFLHENLPIGKSKRYFAREILFGPFSFSDLTLDDAATARNQLA
jgi:hypothetical protein